MKFFKILLIMLFIVLPLTLFAKSQDKPKKAKTIAELVKMYDSSSCKDCHSDIYEEWKKSLHARSIFGPEHVGRTAATFKTTIELGLKDWQASGVKKPEDVRVKHLMICTKCHLPQLEEAEDSVAQEIVKHIYKFVDEGDENSAAILQQLNINCVVCHNRNAIIHKWTEGYPQKGVVYGTKDGDHPDSTYKKMKKSSVMKESILCGQCHGLGPNFEFDNPSQCATLYGSYLWSYVSEGGTKTCQQCHIQESKLGHNMQSYRSKELYEKAVDMKVDAYAYLWRDVVTPTPAAHVKVELTNKAGHVIPDG
ncbi:MAG: multiheme c-type cytochrome ExtKL [Thermodesulfovibrionales bacterium]|nr:multiheme c-type cytochrome ExtKL [Thermodesulfovibrionales bacterium]